MFYLSQTIGEHEELKSCWHHGPLMWCDENGSLPLWPSSPKSVSPAQSWEKHRIPTGGFLRNAWQILLKMARVPKNKIDQPQGAFGDMKTKCNVVSWWNSRAEKSYQVKTTETWIKYGLQLIIFQYWFINYSKCTIQCKMLIIGELGVEYMETVSSSKFFCKSKALL